MTESVAEPSTRARTADDPPRPGIPWRYGMGFVVLLVSILGLVLVGQIAGWIQDPQGAARAGAIVDLRAARIGVALRALPDRLDGVLEARYQAVVAAQMGVLLDVSYPAAGVRTVSATSAARQRLTVRVSGTAAGGILRGHRMSVVTRCFDYEWAADPAALARQEVVCPTTAVLPTSRPGTSTGASVGPSVPPVLGGPVPGGAQGVDALIARLQQYARSGPGTALPPGPAGMDRLLAVAGPAPGTAVDDTLSVGAADSPGETVAAVGAQGAGCLFVDLRAGTVTAWPAPVLDRCTSERAREAVLAGRRAG